MGEAKTKQAKSPIEFHVLTHWMLAMEVIYALPGEDGEKTLGSRTLNISWGTKEAFFAEGDCNVCRQLAAQRFMGEGGDAVKDAEVLDVVIVSVSNLGRCDERKFHNTKEGQQMLMEAKFEALARRQKAELEASQKEAETNPAETLN